MHDADIRDGDYVFVHKTPTAKPGDIVVARFEGEVRVKRYDPHRYPVRSEPEPEPTWITTAEPRTAEPCGVVIGMFRRLS